MGITEAILTAVSLCADCFAVSLCSSVTLKSGKRREILGVALAFAVIQTGLLVAGWALGSVCAGFVEGISHIIGFVLLLYVGGSMLIEGVRGVEEPCNLCGLRNVIIGGVATSIDALAVGVAQSMAGRSWHDISPLAVSVFVVTALSVIAGMEGGSRLGRHFGRGAEIAGGVVLVAIGISLLF